MWAVSGASSMAVVWRLLLLSDSGWSGEPARTRDSICEWCMLICMQSTSVRIDAATHEELKRLATELKTTVGNTVTLAVRALRQDRIGQDVSEPLREDEAAWLGADLG